MSCGFIEEVCAGSSIRRFLAVFIFLTCISTSSVILACFLLVPLLLLLSLPLRLLLLLMRLEERVAVRGAGAVATAAAGGAGGRARGASAEACRREDNDSSPGDSALPPLSISPSSLSPLSPLPANDTLLFDLESARKEEVEEVSLSLSLSLLLSLEGGLMRDTHLGRSLSRMVKKSRSEDVVLLDSWVSSVEAAVSPPWVEVMRSARACGAEGFFSGSGSWTVSASSSLDRDDEVLDRSDDSWVFEQSESSLSVLALEEVSFAWTM